MGDPSHITYRKHTFLSSVAMNRWARPRHPLPAIPTPPRKDKTDRAYEKPEASAAGRTQGIRDRQA